MALALGTCWSCRQLWSRIIWAPASLEAEEALELLPDLPSPAWAPAPNSRGGGGGGCFSRARVRAGAHARERTRVCARTERECAPGQSDAGQQMCPRSRLTLGHDADSLWPVPEAAPSQDPALSSAAGRAPSQLSGRSLCSSLQGAQLSDLHLSASKPSAPLHVLWFQCDGLVFFILQNSF